MSKLTIRIVRFINAFAFQIEEQEIDDIDFPFFEFKTSNGYAFSKTYPFFNNWEKRIGIRNKDFEQFYTTAVVSNFASNRDRDNIIDSLRIAFSELCDKMGLKFKEISEGSSTYFIFE